VRAIAAGGVEAVQQRPLIGRPGLLARTLSGFSNRWPLVVRAADGGESNLPVALREGLCWHLGERLFRGNSPACGISHGRLKARNGVSKVLR
jgi:hypothetical protein